ncbi:MAG: hypothetical protein AB1465_03210 [Patescibacteria group bacterium]
MLAIVWIILSVIFVILLILRLEKRRTARKKENKPPIDLLPVLLKEFFRKGEVVFSSLAPKSIDGRRKIVMKFIFKKQAPANICLKLNRAIVNLSIDETSASFYITRASVSGNVVIFELESQDDNIDKVFKDKRFVNLRNVVIKDTSGEIIYTSRN